MALSRRISDALDVCAEVKAQILGEIDQKREVTLDDVNAIVRQSAERVAGRRGVTVSTVYDHCTRQLKIKSKDFYDYVKEVIKNSDSQHLIETLVAHKCARDDIDEIKKKYSTIF